jgi:hypothetical protein
LNSKPAACILVFLIASCCAPPANSAPAISITGFGAEPERAQIYSYGPAAAIVLRVNVSNAGNATGTVEVIVAVGQGIIFRQNVTLDPGSTRMVNCTWNARAPGKYALSAEISGDGAVQPWTMTANVTVSYIPVKSPSPWYTIPCALLVIIVPAVAIVFAIRWLGRGGNGKADEKRQ